MLLPTTWVRRTLRTWPSASFTDAPVLKAATLALVAWMENPAAARNTPFSHSLLVKLFKLLVATTEDEGAVGAGAVAVVPARVSLLGAPTTLPLTAAPSRKTLMLLPTTCAWVILRTWPSASFTEAPTLKLALLPSLAGMEKPGDLRQTPLSQSVLVKALMLVE